MAYYIGVMLKVLLIELAGVAAMTCVLYVYWNALKDR